MARTVLKDLDPSFADRVQNVANRIMWYDGRDIASSPYGDYWRQMIKLCINDLLSPKMVRLFQSIREEESGRLVNSLRESCGGTVNLSEKLFSYSSSITCRAAFGSVSVDSEALIKMMVDSMKMVGGFEMADMFPSSRIICALSWRKVRLMKAMRHKLHRILDDIIDHHRRNRAESGGRRFKDEDLVDVFLKAKEEEELKFPIDNHNIKVVLFDAFTSGTDTSAAAIDWTMVELMRHPRLMAKVQAEIRQALKENNEQEKDLKYLKLVIKETLRLHPPAPMLPKACNKEHVINGYTIQAGSMVMVNIWAKQRDPRYWKDSEMFNPERFESEDLNFVGSDFKYLPFGFGRSMCPGLTFGLASAESALVQLL
ncbi:premnaspirodiene oxygenase-like [Salvia splendens]|uniref:premnaspirodiene oxygenase-like n=1 Tax=Salvia splendens TaxID=180675 RepID=UPI001C255919|nr:premnaspirodiene oxygenase-like [Salvia splendens]